MTELYIYLNKRPPNSPTHILPTTDHIEERNVKETQQGIYFLCLEFKPNHSLMSGGNRIARYLTILMISRYLDHRFLYTITKTIKQKTQEIFISCHRNEIVTDLSIYLTVNEK